MSLTLTINTRSWRDHVRAIHEEFPGLVPVAKGNGYGFGLDLLAQEAQRHNDDCLAVGTVHEVAAVRAGGWDRDILILSPWRPFDAAATAVVEDPKIITVVSRLEDLDELQRVYPRARVVVELRTSMHRHGIPDTQISQVETGALSFEGWTLHLPLKPALAEAKQLASQAISHQRGAVWVSHLSSGDYRKLRTHLGVRTRMRMGTKLWLEAPGALTTTATVLDIHRVTRGTRYGYHQTRANRDGWLVVLSGGTAHGIALAAPPSLKSLRQRGVTMAQGVMDAVGYSRSPFTIGGRKPPFAEPPHMHASLVFVGGSQPGVAIGDQVPVTVRLTTTTVDEILWN